MAEQQEALVRQFGESQADLEDAVRGLSDQRSEIVWSGTWGVKQILAHIAGWQSTMAQALDKISHGERPSVDGVNLNDTDGTNDAFAQRAAAQTLTEVLGELHAASDRFEAAIRALPDDRIVEGRTARRIVEQMIRHPGEHTDEIRAWRSQQPDA